MGMGMGHVGYPKEFLWPLFAEKSNRSRRRRIRGRGDVVHLSHINFHCAFQVALKRQQAVEDAIAMRLVANKTGRSIDALPPGNIFGLTVTQPSSPRHQKEEEQAEKPLAEQEEEHSEPPAVAQDLSAPRRENVSQTAIDMLAQLFPQRKRSVLELVLKRCDLDLIRAIENVSPAGRATPVDVTTNSQPNQDITQPSLPLATPSRSSAFRPVIADQVRE